MAGRYRRDEDGFIGGPTGRGFGFPAPATVRAGATGAVLPSERAGDL